MAYNTTHNHSLSAVPLDYLVHHIGYWMKSFPAREETEDAIALWCAEAVYAIRNA
jgi:hypothetical protein